MSTLSEVIGLLTLHKYAILLPVSILEGPIITVIAGFLVSKGILGFWLSYLILMIGDLVGDVVYYGIGRWGGRHFIHKWGKYMGLNENTVLKTEHHFKHHSIKTLAFGKTQVIGGVVLAAAGMAKMPILKFLIINLLASLVKVMGLLILGYYFGHAYTSIQKYLGIYGEITVGILILVLLYFLIRKKKQT